MRVDMVSAVAVVVVCGVVSTALGHEGLPSEYNFRDDVRPIFVEHCSGCHRPGGVGPMSLLSYSDAVPWANAIKMQVLGDQMPPWLPAEGIGRFRHTRALSAAEIDVLLDWIIGQTPEGEPMTADEVAVEPPPEWSMGTPDLVLIPEAEIVIGEDDYELTRCVVLPAGNSEPLVASAFELKPGLATIVRRATIYLGSACEETRPLATWLPGQKSGSPSAPGHEIPARSSFAVELLYVKGWEDEGKRLTDRSALGIELSEGGRALSSVRLFEERTRFPESVELVAIYPEPSAGGSPGARLTLELVRPDGVTEPILVIEEFKPEWGERYLLAEPVRVPAGSELQLSQPAVWIDFIASASAPAE